MVTHYALFASTDQEIYNTGETTIRKEVPVKKWLLNNSHFYGLLAVIILATIASFLAIEALPHGLRPVRLEGTVFSFTVSAENLVVDLEVSSGKWLDTGKVLESSKYLVEAPLPINTPISQVWPESSLTLVCKAWTNLQRAENCQIVK